MGWDFSMAPETGLEAFNQRMGWTPVPPVCGGGELRRLLPWELARTPFACISLHGSECLGSMWAEGAS